jgi:hypothetical protein
MRTEFTVIVVRGPAPVSGDNDPDGLDRRLAATIPDGTEARS